MFKTNFSGRNKTWETLPLNPSPRGYGPVVYWIATCTRVVQPVKRRPLPIRTANRVFYLFMRYQRIAVFGVKSRTKKLSCSRMTISNCIFVWMVCLWTSFYGTSSLVVSFRRDKTPVPCVYLRFAVVLPVVDETLSTCKLSLRNIDLKQGCATGGPRATTRPA